jgi:NAD(P)-dependent dehydrogenase (short-subunit alcohol dehydrogenase family)
MNQPSLTGRIAVITGGSRGLGRGMAVALAQAGATIALVARDQEQLELSAQAVAAAGSQASVHRVDVTDETQVKQLAADLQARYGKVHILINNAGVNVRKSVTEFTLEEWRRVVDTNLTSAFLLCRSMVPLMQGQGYGRILNLTSIMSHVALPGRAAYAASKAGLLGFTRALALELAPSGITVNGISPGPVATEMNLPITQNPELNQQFIARLPVGRWGKVEEIAALALYLCSDAAAFMTGTDLVIDGGWCAQ